MDFSQELISDSNRYIKAQDDEKKSILLYKKQFRQSVKFKEAKELINALRKGDVFYSNDALYKKGGYKYMPLKNARIRGFKTLEDREVLTLETITNYIIITFIDGFYNIKIKPKYNYYGFKDEKLPDMFFQADIHGGVPYLESANSSGIALVYKLHDIDGATILYGVTNLFKSYDFAVRKEEDGYYHNIDLYKEYGISYFSPLIVAGRTVIDDKAKEILAKVKLKPVQKFVRKEGDNVYAAKRDW